MPRPVIFDLYHTLVPGADDERDRVVAEMAVIVGVDPTTFVDAYHASWRERLVRWDVVGTVRVLARRVGGDPTDEQVTRAAALRRTLARRLLEAVSPATLGALDALRGDGHPLALVSNATSETSAAWPGTALARRFDAAVFSCDVGLAKPDPVIYRLAAERLGADPARCVFVGDGADGELAGAAAAGMTVVRTTEHADSDPAWVGPECAALGDLHVLLPDIARSVDEPAVDARR
ncbi:HAD family hydrolase [Plantactinospora sp. GCM10030261]|uniref:HAD family hydrolase n=1 Tax=Plantactinospora sp. GCM10030261 TaxID=3273420 RepID=UPI00360F47F0